MNEGTILCKYKPKLVIGFYYALTTLEHIKRANVVTKTKIKFSK